MIKFDDRNTDFNSTIVRLKAREPENFLSIHKFQFYDSTIKRVMSAAVEFLNTFNFNSTIVRLKDD